MAIHASRYSGRRGARRSVGSRGSQRKRRSFRGKFAGALFLLVLAGIAYLAYVLWQPFPKLPQQNDYPISLNYKDRTNILLSRIEGDEVKYLAVVSLVEGDRTRIFTINPAVVTQLPQGKGEYTLSMVVQLGDKNGVNLLRDAVSRLLAVPIDGYVVANDAGWKSVQSIYGDNYDSLVGSVSSVVGRISVAWQGLPKGVYTSFSKIEFAKMGIKEYGVLEVIDGGKYEVAQSAVGVGFDRSSFDDQVGRDFNEKSVTHDHPRVSVVNGSGMAGVGIELARYVRNLGGQVVNVSTADKPSKTTQILDHLGGSTFSSRLDGVVRGNVVSDSKLSQSDIEITVGEDAKSWF